MFGSIPVGNRSVYNGAAKLWVLGKMKSMSRTDLNNWRELIRDTIDAAVQGGMQKEVRGLFVLERKINETLQKHSPYSANNQDGTGS